jgi:hypothetical protein
METQEEICLEDSFDNENSMPPKGVGFIEGFKVKVLTMNSVLRWRLSSLIFAHIL